MKQLIKQTITTAAFFCAFGVAPTVYAGVTEVATLEGEQLAGQTYAQELEALIKWHQQEWDAMIADQQKTLAETPSEEDRTALEKEYEIQRDTMSARHKEEIPAFKEKNKKDGYVKLILEYRGQHPR